MQRERDFDKWTRQAPRQDRARAPSPATARSRTKRRSGASRTRTSASSTSYAQPTRSEIGDRARPADARRSPRSSTRSSPSEGAVAWLRESSRDAGLVHGEGYLAPRGANADGARHRARSRGLSPPRAAREDRRRADRRAHERRALLRRRSRTPTTSSPRFRAATRSAGYVMAGAHLGQLGRGRRRAATTARARWS